MESDDIEELFSQAGRLLKFLGTAFEDMTGEDLDLESAVRHYPLVAIGLAAGSGALGGWLLARRSKPQLPPPPTKRPLELPDSLRDIRARLRPSDTGKPGQEPSHPLDYLEQLIPEGMDRLRNVLPEVTPEEAATMAREWVDTILEPRMKQGFDTMIESVSTSKFGVYFKRRTRPSDEESEPES